MSAEVVQVDFSTRTESSSLKRRGFTSEDIDRAERFGRPVTALYRLIDVPNGVQTPDGQGTLLRAFSDEALVVLTRERPMNSYKGGKPYKPMESYDPEDLRPA